MDLDTQDVSASTGSASPDVAVSSDSIVASASQSSADVQTQTDGVGAQTSEGESVALQADDPLFGVPTKEELEANPNQPYAKALTQLRSAYETLRPQLDTLKPLEAWKDVAGKYQDPSTVESRLGLVDSLFSPVMENGAPVLDRETGLPQKTAKPFLDNLSTQSPQTLNTLLRDALAYEMDGKTLLQHAIAKGGYVLAKDVAVNGAVAPEELQRIPENFRGAYQTLPQATRESIIYSLDQIADGETGEYTEAQITQLLSGIQNGLDVASFKEEQAQRETQAKQAQAQTFQRETEQLAYQSVEKLRTDSFTTFKENIASQWKPSTDEKVNALEYGGIMSLALTLIDPNFRALVLPDLQAAGIEVDAEKIDGLLLRTETGTMNHTRFGRYEETFNANQAQSDASNAQQQLMAYLHTIAMKYAEHRDGQLTVSRQAQENGFQRATARPAVTGQLPSQSSGKLELPPEFRKDPFGAGATAWLNAQAQ